MLIFFLLIGRYLDFNVKQKAFNIARDLNIVSNIAVNIIEKGKKKIISAKNLKKI